jgi:hypothetical protein
MNEQGRSVKDHERTRAGAAPTRTRATDDDKGKDNNRGEDNDKGNEDDGDR